MKSLYIFLIVALFQSCYLTDNYQSDFAGNINKNAVGLFKIKKSQWYDGTNRWDAPTEGTIEVIYKGPNSDYYVNFAIKSCYLSWINARFDNYSFLELIKSKRTMIPPDNIYIFDVFNPNASIFQNAPLNYYDSYSIDISQPGELRLRVFYHSSDRFVDFYLEHIK